MRTWHKLLFLVVPTGVVLFLFASQGVSQGADVLAKGSLRIETTITPGKPGAPTESLSVVRKDNSFLLEAKRIAQEGPTVQESVKITEKQFDSIRAIVTKRTLLTWLPTGPGPRGADMGENRLKIEWQPLYLGQPNVHSVGWAGKLSPKDKAVLELRAKITQLAAPNLKKVKMHYFKMDQ